MNKDLLGTGAADASQAPSITAVAIDSQTPTTLYAATTDRGVQAFECRLDNAAFTACASAATYAVATRGSHTFRVRAIDTNGFRDATPASITWTR